MNKEEIEKIGLNILLTISIIVPIFGVIFGIIMLVSENKTPKIDRIGKFCLFSGLIVCAVMFIIFIIFVQSQSYYY